MRNRSTRSVASRSSFFTRRLPQLLPSGWARCTVAPALLDHVGGPVPAIGRLQDHLGVLAGLGQLGGQGHRVVVDPDRVEGLAGLVAPHDHAAASVQVDADVLLLLFHGSLLPSFPGWFGNPKCASHTWSGRREDSRWVFGLDRLVAAALFVGTGSLLMLGVRAWCAHRARHAGAALRSFITSDVLSGSRDLRSHRSDAVPAIAESGSSNGCEKCHLASIHR